VPHPKTYAAGSQASFSSEPRTCNSHLVLRHRASRADDGGFGVSALRRSVSDASGAASRISATAKGPDPETVDS
jgi:hypothetical protein